MNGQMNGVGEIVPGENLDLGSGVRGRSCKRHSWLRRLMSTSRAFVQSALRERIEERVREMRETEGPALRERVMQQAAAIGMTIEELVQLESKRRGRLPIEPWPRCTGSTRSLSDPSRKTFGLTLARPSHMRKWTSGVARCSCATPASAMPNRK